VSPTTGHLESTLLLVLVQLIVIVACSRAFSTLFRRMGQPRVCGEIAAGLILGPSVLGRIFPQISHRVFDPSVGLIFSIMSQLGLIFLMFIIGLEFDFGHLSDNRHAALSISSVGIVLPFGLGLLIGRWMHGALGLGGSWLKFALWSGHTRVRPFTTKAVSRRESMTPTGA